ALVPAAALAATRPTVGLDLDETAGDACVTKLVEHTRIHVCGQLDDREVRLDVDGTEVVAAEAALVRERAHDLTRLDAVAPADLDAVRRVVAAPAALARLTGRAIAGIALRAVVPLDGCGQRVVLRI